ncbi:hypothetical protein BGP_0573 [Beggiatoa sp. PS]|nr:hypothetical protein BGP_0573 [Beggiatoa sp. PS]
MKCVLYHLSSLTNHLISQNSQSIGNALIISTYLKYHFHPTSHLFKIIGLLPQNLFWFLMFWSPIKAKVSPKLLP